MVDSKQRYEEYPEYKNSGAEWIGDIPSHWHLIYSKWLFKDRNIKASPGDEMLTASQKYGVIPQKLFMEIEQQRVVQVFKGHDILKRVEKGDFVISMRSFQGGLEFCNYSGAISSAYVPLEPQADISSKYFKYLFKSEPYIQALQSTSNLVRDGQALRYSNFIQVDLPVVSFDEAEKIGSFLDHETAKIDILIEKQQRLIELLTEKRQAVISHAVTKGLNPDVPMKDSGVEWLGDVPEHWDINKLRYKFDFGSGLNITKANLKETGVPCINYGEIHSKYGFEVNTDVHQLKCVDELYLKARPGALLNQGDFIFADTSEDIEGAGNFTQLVSCSSAFAGYHTVIARPKDKLGIRFYAYLLDSVPLRTQIRTSVKGVKVFSITQSILKSINIWIPPLNEREEIAEYLDEQTYKIDALIAKANQQIQLMQERRTALISAAVTGKIDVRDWVKPE